MVMLNNLNKWLISKDTSFNNDLRNENLYALHFRNLILRSRSKKYRHQTKEMVIEGLSAVKSAMDVGARLKSLYFSGSDTLQLFDEDDLQGVELYKVKYETVKICTQTEMPDGVLGKNQSV